MVDATSSEGLPITHADSSHGVTVFTAVYLSVLPHGISKTDAARKTKLDVDMVHRESWKPIYSAVKRSKVKVTRHEKQCRCGFLHSCECWLRVVYTVTVVHLPLLLDSGELIIRGG